MPRESSNFSENFTIPKLTEFVVPEGVVTISKSQKSQYSSDIAVDSGCYEGDSNKIDGEENKFSETKFCSIKLPQSAEKN